MRCLFLHFVLENYSGVCAMDMNIVCELNLGSKEQKDCKKAGNINRK